VYGLAGTSERSAGRRLVLGNVRGRYRMTSMIGQRAQDTGSTDGINIRAKLETPKGKAPVRKRKRMAKGIRVRPRERAKEVSSALGWWMSEERIATIKRGETMRGTAWRMSQPAVA
jgi:hypothetical protein